MIGLYGNVVPQARAECTRRSAAGTAHCLRLPPLLCPRDALRPSTACVLTACVLTAQSVANFVALCTGAAGGGYAGTRVAAVRPGEYIQAGAAGSARLGDVEAPLLSPNPEVADAKAFRLTHRAPGTGALHRADGSRVARAQRRGR